jgi:hypothetical protein
MLLPGGNSVWMKLPLTFLDIKELILFLKKQEFSGSIHFSFPDTEGLIALQEGDVILGLEKRNGRWKGEKPTGRILERAHSRRDGTINVFRYPSDTVGIISEIFNFPAEVVYQDLSSEFTHFGKFLSQLHKGRFSGFIEIRPSDPRKNDIEYVLFTQGEITAMVTRSFQGHIDRDKPTDMRKLQVYIQQIQAQGIYYSVFAKVRS